ncbi:ImmA/IrrE family metallo-endopeptidase [Sporosarcina sp. SAFN-010]|uniref:ImmA/IrrE family metallo-endopeptidase n=1 Tax=Sporosarcina sp. SAFN-010 TaxID=3387273 RepID=UPI003F7CF5A6
MIYLPYEKLLHEAFQQGVEVYEEPLKGRIKGLYSDNFIKINKLIPTSIEKCCVLAEELGHYHTSCGVILDQTKLMNRKQEKRARNWAYKRLVPLSSFIDAYKSGIKNRYELAFYLGVTEPFIEETLYRYKEEHGLFAIVDDYAVYFEPLGVLEKNRF